MSFEGLSTRLEGRLVVLEPLTAGHEAGLARAAADDEVWRWMPRVISGPEDFHGWMAAHVGVMSHPFFAVTDKAGAFSIKGLPPGTYTLEAWHETFGTRTQQVTIAPSGQQTVALAFSAK